MKKKITNIQLILVLGLLIKGLGLIYRILLTRILTIEGMRIMSLIFPTLSLILCLSSLSISTVVNQNIAAKLNKVSTILKSAFNITFVSSSLISILLLCSFPIYKIIYQNSYIYYPLLICIPLIYLSNSSGILKGYLEANNNFTYTYISNFFEQIAKFFITFLLLFIFKNQKIENKILLCFIALMSSEIVSFTYLVLKIKKKYNGKYIGIKTNGFEKEILKQALPLTLDQLITTIASYLEPLTFYYALGLKGYDFYDATIYYTKVTAYAIPLLIFTYFGVLSIAKFAFPKITKLQNDKSLNTLIERSIFIALIISSFNLIICSFYSKEALNLTYGDYSAYLLTSKLAPFYFFTYFNPLFVIILQAFKKEKVLFIISLFSSIVLLVTIFIATYLIGKNGLIIGITTSNIFKFILLSNTAIKYSKFNPNKKNTILSIGLITIYYIANYLFHNLFTFIFSTLICGLLAIILYLFFYQNKTKHHHDKKHKESF